MDKCEGACEDHAGSIKKVKVYGWSGGPITFHYCQTAIECDEGNGFLVEVLDKEPGDG